MTSQFFYLLKMILSMAVSMSYFLYIFPNKFSCVRYLVLIKRQLVANLNDGEIVDRSIYLIANKQKIKIDNCFCSC